MCEGKAENPFGINPDMLFEVAFGFFAQVGLTCMNSSAGHLSRCVECAPCCPYAHAASCSSHRSHTMCSCSMSVALGPRQPSSGTQSAYPKRPTTPAYNIPSDSTEIHSWFTCWCISVAVNVLLLPSSTLGINLPNETILLKDLSSADAVMLYRTSITILITIVELLDVLCDIWVTRATQSDVMCIS
jgi:hypothetical protein